MLAYGCGVQNGMHISLASLFFIESTKKLWISCFPGYLYISLLYEIKGMHFSMQPHCLYFFVSGKCNRAKRNHIGSANKLSFNFASSPNKRPWVYIYYYGSVPFGVCDESSL